MSSKLYKYVLLETSCTEMSMPFNPENGTGYAFFDNAPPSPFPMQSLDAGTGGTVGGRNQLLTPDEIARRTGPPPLVRGQQEYSLLTPEELLSIAQALDYWSGSDSDDDDIVEI